MAQDSSSDSGRASKGRTAHPFRFFVCGFNASVTESELMDFFAERCPIVEARIIKDPDGSSRGYGIITTLKKKDNAELLDLSRKLTFKGRLLSIGPAFRRFDPRELDYSVATPHGVFPSQSIATKHQFMLSTVLYGERGSYGNSCKNSSQESDHHSSVNSVNKSPDTKSQVEFPAINAAAPTTHSATVGFRDGSGQKPRRELHHSAEQNNRNLSNELQHTSYGHPADSVAHHNPVPLMSTYFLPPNVGPYIGGVPPHALYGYSFIATPNGNIPAVLAYPPSNMVSPIGHVQFVYPPTNIIQGQEHGPYNGNQQGGDASNQNRICPTSVTSFDSGIGDVSNCGIDDLQHSFKGNFNLNPNQPAVKEIGKQEDEKGPLTYSQAVSKKQVDSVSDARNVRPRERKNTATSGSNKKDNSARIFPPVLLENRQRGDDGYYVEPSDEKKDQKRKRHHFQRSDWKIPYNRKFNDTPSCNSTGSVCNQISRLDLKDTSDKRIHLDKNMNLTGRKPPALKEIPLPSGPDLSSH